MPSYKLVNKDYISILKFYDIPIPKSKRQMKQLAEKIMAEKLCKCIKKVNPENEAKSIGICSKTIFNSKGLSRGTFQCKSPQSVKIRKALKNKTKKSFK